MIEYDLKKNNNKKNEKAYGKYYAKPHVIETIDLEALAEQMHTFNSPFSAGTIQGILTDAVVHIKELLLAGKNVKLDNLAIFYIGIKNKEGAATEDDFSVLKNVLGVRMRARATGDFRFVNLNLDANLKRHAPKKKKKMPLMMVVAVLLPIRTVRREDREVPTPLSRAARKRGRRNLVRILAAPNLVIT